MQFIPAIRQWCVGAALVAFSALARSQAGQLGAIHVDPQDSKAGIRMSSSPPVPFLLPRKRRKF